MRSSPNVFVVVLAWNHLADTLECLESLYRIDYSNYCVVLVDNGSSDGTPEAVRQKYPAAHIIENGRNLGYAEGNNVGICHALDQGADSILILNNDTVVDKSALAALVSLANDNPRVGILAPSIYWHPHPKVIWSEGAKWIAERAAFVPLRSGETDNLDQVQAPFDADSASGCALYLSAKVARDVGPFDARFFLTWEEADWCSRARRRGYRVLIEPRARVWHKTSASFEGSAQGAQYQYYYSRNRLLWIEKNLRGRDRLRAFSRCAREYYWCLLRLRDPRVSKQDASVERAKLTGVLHYLVRRFGQAPALPRAP